MPHDYLTVADVLGMHTVLMQRYGGAPGVRDPGERGHPRSPFSASYLNLLPFPFL